MNDTGPARLTFPQFMAREMANAETTVEWMTEKLALPSENVLKGFLSGMMKAPASLIYPFAKTLDLDPAHVLHVYLRDCLPDVECAIFDCEGMMPLTKQERLLVEMYRQRTDDKSPEVVIFENKSVVALAIT